MFETLVVSELLLCTLLGVAALKVFAEIAPAPEVDLGQRAWIASRFSMAEADALGPLFRHLVRASRKGLQLSHRLQERIRTERLRHRSPRVLSPVVGLWQRRRTQRSAELAELSHLVEQLEQMGSALARYRAGRGGLMELRVPLSCIDAAASEQHIA